MKPFNQIIVRIPQLPISASISEYCIDLRNSIKVSSPEFFELIKDIDCLSIDSLPVRQKLTILKYLNRSKYRCVPFGTFSSIGTAYVNNDANSQMVIKNREVDMLIDWKEIQNVQYSFSDLLKRDFKVFANSTYYTFGKQIRYVRRTGKKFELAQIEGDLNVSYVLRYCRKPIKLSELFKLLLPQCSKKEISSLIEDLIYCGLLITELEPNLLGMDYFQRIGYQKVLDAGAYHIARHSFVQDNIEQKYTKNIPALIDLLTTILPEPEDSQDMIDFRNRFAKRFDRRDVPIMVAIDPEIGVGYGKLHSKDMDGNLLSKLISGDPKRVGTEHSFFNKYGHFTVGETINLPNDPKDYKPSTNKPLPNSCSLIGSIVDDHLVIERIGGYSFTQLAGRFTTVNNDILNLCKNIAEIEQNANTEVIFFDIAYNAEDAVDNVNRRQRIYQHELNLLNFSVLKEPITLDDLYISVSGREIILRSKKLSCRMIPRMSSAYNYRRSDLPVFRFLYDLSFYGIWPELAFDPLVIFPGKQYYPRFQFRNIILSLAKIKITKEVVIGRNLTDKISCLRSLIGHFQLGNTIKVLSGGEPLVVDCSDENDMKLLIVELEKKATLYVEEFPLPKNPLVLDNHGNGFVHQLIIPLVHQEEVYYGSGKIADIDGTYERTFLPGKEWLSLEIYGHPGGVDQILTGPLVHVLDRFKKQIKCWFFVRYNENGDHLRFRLQLKQMKYREEVMECIHSVLDPFYKIGQISDVCLRTYNREMERYAIAGMERVEQHFSIDSEHILKIISAETGEELRYIYCLQLFLAVKQSGVIAEERFDSWTEHICQSLSQEHEMDIEQYKLINQYYKTHNIYRKAKETALLQGSDMIIMSLIKLIKACPNGRKAPFFTDMMHMHINRLFADQQRAHEMVIYNFLIIILKQAKYRS